jgi:aldose 1-epimerase
MINVIHKNNLLDEIVLANEEMEVHVLNLGCTIKNIYVKDQEGHKRDVILGYDDVLDYMCYDGYLGACVGRVANRIKHGQFTLDDKTYHLPINNGPNAIHGGLKGFSYRLFDYTIDGDRLIFHYLSPDGEEGYPGTLDLYITYILEETTLKIDYKATTNKKTLINLTNHTYFNLEGKPGYVGDHLLKIKASKYACVDQDGLVTGEVKNVTHTPFDFRNEKPMKKALISNDPQIIIARGLDHPFLFDQNDDQVVLTSNESGITLTVSTSLPQAQIYTANYLDGRLGKHHEAMNKQNAVCIETQYMPDAIHLEEDPPVILSPEDVYHETTSYTFSTH